MTQRDQQHLCSPGTRLKVQSLERWVKDLTLPQLWRRSQQQLGYIPWLGNSICLRVVKKEKKIILQTLPNVPRGANPPTQLTATDHPPTQTPPCISGPGAGSYR